MCKNESLETAQVIIRACIIVACCYNRLKKHSRDIVKVIMISNFGTPMYEWTYGDDIVFIGRDREPVELYYSDLLQSLYKKLNTGCVDVGSRSLS